MPDTPEMYYVEAALTDNESEAVIDDYIDRFGFREIKLQGKHILMNGKKLRIRGLCRHEDHPQFGCALPYGAITADLEIIKHLGANSVRTSHYPNDEVFLDLCDEQGILVWEENHARGLSLEDMKNPNFEPQAEQVIREMIPAHYNHPSIYIWGILNECASDSEYGKECYEKQFKLIKELDTSRPHSFASCKFKTDICFGLPDVVSYNIYPLWYHDTPVDEYLDDLYQWIQNETEGAGKPFLITEIGAGGLYGYRNPYSSKWTEEYQAEALKKQLKAVLDYKDCCGVYIWQFCDIRISEEWFGGRPRTMNNKGIVDEYRRRKLAYSVVKRIFEQDKNSKSKTGYVSEKTIYRCENCESCPYKKDCIKGNNCKTPLEERTKTLQVAKTFLKYRQEDLERILSDDGILFRTNRSIQAEGSFGDLKQDMQFRRYLSKGTTNVLAESTLLAMARNINKLHNKIQKGKTGTHLFPLKSA